MIGETQLQQISRNQMTENWRDLVLMSKDILPKASKDRVDRRRNPEEEEEEEKEVVGTSK